WRQQRKLLPARRCDAINATMGDPAGKHINLYLHGLAGLNVGELRLLEVADNVGIRRRNDGHKLRAGLNELPNAKCTIANYPIDRRHDGGIAEIQFSLLLDRKIAD